MGSIHGWKILWRRTQKPTPALLPGESCGQKSLVVYNLHRHRVEHGWSYLICMHVPSVNTLMRIFIMIGCWILPDIFFCVYWDNHVIFIFYFVNVVYNIDWFENTEPSLHPWNKSHLIRGRTSIVVIFFLLVGPSVESVLPDYTVSPCLWPVLLWFLLYIFCCRKSFMLLLRLFSQRVAL